MRINKVIALPCGPLKVVALPAVSLPCALTLEYKKVQQKKKMRRELIKTKIFSTVYAHIEIVVAFLVVNFFGFLVITRDHGGFEGRH